MSLDDDSPLVALKFQSWSSVVDIGFWHELARRKLDVYKLDESPLPLVGQYSTGTGRTDLGARFLLHDTSLVDSAAAIPEMGEALRIAPHHYASPGTLYNTNTVDSFKALDKSRLLKEAASAISADISSGRAIKDPSLLTRFILLTYADLKKYKFYYMFGFPALNFPHGGKVMVERVQPIGEWLQDAQCDAMQRSYAALSAEEGEGIAPSHFLCKCVGDAVHTAPLSAWEEFWDEDEGECAIAFADPSSLPEHPGWPLRNTLLLAAWAWKLKRVRVLCYRTTHSSSSSSSSTTRDISHSIAMTCVLPNVSSAAATTHAAGEDDVALLHHSGAVVGWERNERAKAAPRVMCLGGAMDPTRLAATSVDLNLKLMKWRLMPSLQLERVKNVRALLIGAGTLGCNVARALLGWGVRHISFVDNGTVSYSNPVRQTLFQFEDCLHGGKHKAKAAAERLKQIFPGVTSNGYVMTVPMPGHTIAPSEVTKAEKEYNELCALIESHDVIFLGTDSRESRWLPTVLALKYDKLLINAALGFDTFVVMRHGARRGSPRLGCYFCNDVVAPQDSLTDRSLDQQCTVTRPGVSFLAASMAVELMVSVLQHPMGALAPADAGIELSQRPKHPLGVLPHQIRGFLSHFTNVIPVGMHFDKCTGCSEKVLEALLKDEFEFVRNVCHSPLVLEEVSGLAELRDQSVEDTIAWDEDDF